MLAVNSSLLYRDHAQQATTPAMRQSRTQVPSNLDAFVRQTSRRAQIMAEIALRNREAALDIVQDSFLALVSRYAQRPAEEWAPLFYTILQSRIMDWKRREARRGKWLTWLQRSDDEDDSDLFDQLPSPHDEDPAVLLARADDMALVRRCLEQLPLRQQQAFMLRAWEGLDTAATAKAMDCSDSSVKTHYARALAALRLALGDALEKPS